MKRRLLALLIAAAFLAGTIAPTFAADKAEAQFKKIKADLKSFMASEAKKPYRHNWLRLIDRLSQFQARNPKSKYAAEALYVAAGAYADLYDYSYLKDDLEGSVKLYEKMLSLYPGSDLAAGALVKEAEVLEDLDRNAEAWSKYDQCVTDHPKGNMTPKAAAGKKRLAKFAPKKTAAKETEKKPRASVKTETPPTATQIPTTTAGPVGTQSTVPPAPPPISPVEPAPDESAGGQPVVRKVDHWSTPDYTRIVIEVSDKVEFAPSLLEKEAGKDLPRRLFIDFKKCVMAPELAAEVPIEDGLLKRVRVGQNTDDVVRVVLDIQSITDFQVFPIFEPFRVVIDVMGEKKPAPAPPQPGRQKQYVVVLDPGHGGGDPGAMSRKGDEESKFVLTIAKKVEAEFKNDSRVKIVMTRATDVFIPLPQRTAIANKADADLFVSVHINAAANRDAYGLEIYHFAPRAQREDQDLVAAENGTATESVDALNPVLAALAQSYKKDESNSLARMIERTMLKTTRRQYSDAICRKVHSAPFYVLLGARMPAVLVECGFITNKMELARIKEPKYQDALAKGIADGIRAYFAGYK